MSNKIQIVVLGAAESGIGAALLAKAKGLSVFVSDSKSIADKYKAVLINQNISFEENGHSDTVYNALEVVKSPGIPNKALVVKKIESLNIPVISEIEFAARYASGFLIGITGSNGKTTTTSLVHHLLTKAGFKAALCGNIGKSFAACVAEDIYTHYVIEISSFQLDNVKNLKLNIAILTNITPDHLDRYEYKVENYAAAKFNIGINQTKADHFIYSLDCPLTAQYLSAFPQNATMYGFSYQKTEASVAYTQENQIFININQIPFSMSIHDLALQGRHNFYNSMAAGVTGRIMDIRKEVIRESLSDFQGIEHRLEFVAKIHGISFVNDSKATNVNSTWYALESINEPIIWIVGGVDKGNQYAELDELVKSKVKAIVCLGTDNQKIINHFSGLVENIVETNSAHKAVAAAYQLGKKGDTVLLSPCCASFDLFDNYEDRGLQFKKAVKSL